MAIAPLLISIRTQGAAAIGRAISQLNRTARAAQQLQRGWRAHTRAVSSVAGAYQDANGLWRNANGTLLTQRHRVTQVTTAYGRLIQRVQRATNAVQRFGRAAGRIGSVILRVGGAVAPFAALSAKILLVVSAATALTGVVGNLLGALQLIAPAIIAAGSAMAVWKMATAGVADALKAGIDGDVEAFNAALKKLTPSAVAAVHTLLDLRKEWRSTQKAVQESFFRGFRDDAIAVSRALQPVANTWLPRIAGMFAQTRTVLRSVFVEAAKSGQLEKIMQGVSRGIGGLLNVLPPLARALFDVAEVASGAFGDIGAGAQSAAQRFADWIRQAKESGKLKEWLDKAIDALKSLKEIAGNVGEMIGAVFRGASDSGQSLLEKVTELTQRMADWLNSSDGQDLIETLSSIVGWVIACKPAFEVLAVVIKAVMAVASAAWGAFFQIVKFVVNWILSGYSMLLTGAEKAFGWIPGLKGKLDAARAQFESWKNSVNQSIDGVKDTIDITVRYRAVRIGPHMMSGSQLSSDYSSGIGGRASGGGVMAGRTYMVGERGPELVTFGGSGMVHNAQTTRRAMSGGGGGGGAVQLVVAPGADSKAAEFVKALVRAGVLSFRVVGNKVVPG